MHEESELEVRARIDATRDRMQETLERIGDRVNPDRVRQEVKDRARQQVDEIKDNVKRKVRHTMDDVQHGVRDTGRGIWGTIRDNPIPAGMIGVGMAWLVNNARDRDSHRHVRDYPETGRIGEHDPYNRYRAVPASYGGTHAYGGSASYGRHEERYDTASAPERGEDEGTVDRMKHRAGEAAGEVADRARDIGHKAQDLASEAGHRAERVAGGVADRAGDLVHRARRTERRMEDRVSENPLAASAVAAALGFAAGMMIPETERERELMGDARHRVVDKARDTARRAADSAHEKAREVAGESARRAVDEVWPGGGEESSMTDPER